MSRLICSFLAGMETNLLKEGGKKHVVLSQLLRQQALHTCSTGEQEIHSQLPKVKGSRNLNKRRPPAPPLHTKYVVDIQDTFCVIILLKSLAET